MSHYDNDEREYVPHPITRAFMKTSCRKDITEKRRTQAHIGLLEDMLEVGAVNDVMQGLKTLNYLKTLKEIDGAVYHSLTQEEKQKVIEMRKVAYLDYLKDKNKYSLY